MCLLQDHLVGRTALPPIDARHPAQSPRRSQTDRQEQSSQAHWILYELRTGSKVSTTSFKVGSRATEDGFVLPRVGQQTLDPPRSRCRSSSGGTKDRQPLCDRQSRCTQRCRRSHYRVQPLCRNHRSQGRIRLELEHQTLYSRVQARPVWACTRRCGRSERRARWSCCTGRGSGWGWREGRSAYGAFVPY